MPGGVCAVLDYEVDLMADYVAEMATRVVMPRNVVNQSFRKYVSQILSSTRLPRTTILLGLNYLAKRINLMTSGPVQNEGEIWRMLTIALLLGSKFLDDNTFQNKSWSEVSGIPVHELNTMENEWLGVMNWNLYVNLDKSNDYTAWLDNWDEWKATKKQEQQQQANRERLSALAPLDTDVGRRSSMNFNSTWYRQQVAEYERLSSLKQAQAAPVSPYRSEQASWNYMQWHQAPVPLTPPDSGYGTPEHTSSATSVNSHYTEWFDRAIVGGCNASRQYQQPPSYNNGYRHNSHSARTSVNYGAFYSYGHNIWEHPSSADCTCSNCLAVHSAKPSAYFPTHAYGQPVMG